MKRIVVGLVLVAAGFIGGLIAQQPQFGRLGQGAPGGFFVPFAAGTVSRIQGNTIEVEARFGERTFARTVILTNQTRIQKSQPGTKADIKPNAFAFVQGQPDPKSGWLHARVVVVMPQLPEQAGMVIGRIYDVRNQGNQFGVSIPVSATPNLQVYKMTPAKVTDIKQGERIVVRGRPEEGTGNLIAEDVVIGEMPPLFGPGFGGRGPGFGRPGGFGGERSFQQRGQRQSTQVQR